MSPCKKGVRALALHPKDFTLLSGSADNIKKFGMPDVGRCKLTLSNPR